MYLIKLLDIYTFGLFIYCVLSFIHSVPFVASISKVLDIFYKPLLDLIGNLIKPIGAGGVGLDLSPFALFIILEIIRRILINVFR